MDPSHVDSDSAHHGHHNTDSMVTVPLSDVQSNADPSPQTPVDDSPHMVHDTNTTPVHGHALKSELDPDQDRTLPSIPPPHSGMDQAEDPEDDVVDWAELEKTEEQEPRGEQSDEVCCRWMEYSRHSVLTY